MARSLRLPPAAIAVLVAAIALAGCLGALDDPLAPSGADGAGSADAGDAEAALDPPVPLDEVVAQDHDHGDRSAHGFQWNLEDAGYHHGYGSADEARGGYTAMALDRPYAYLCRGGPQSGVVAFDVSDPSDPRPVDRFAMPGCNDVEVSDDGSWLVAGTQRNDVDEALREADAPAAFPRGAYLIDASDPSALSFEDYLPVPYNGVHTVSHHTTGDGRVVFNLQTYELYSQADPTGHVPTAPPGAAPLAHRVEITEVAADPAGDGYHLERLGVYSETGGAVQEPDDQVITHHSWMGTHPETGERLMLVAYWDQGVHVVNVDDLSNPAFVSRFDDFAPSSYDNIHQVKPFPATIDGRWVVVAEPELATADESGQVTLVDATDPRDPRKLGHWTLPGDVIIPEPYLFSPHNFDVDDEGRIYLSHQHAGAWVISVDGPGTLEDPVTVGAVEFTAPDGVETGGPGPMTWGVHEEDGYLFASDSPTGLHVKRYTGP